MSLAEDLYERDYYAWALQQAEALRRREAGTNALDWDNLAEEVEGLARSDLRSCESLLRAIVEHLLKVAASAEGETAVGHWRKEIDEFRAQIEATLSPTLRLRLQEQAPAVIARAIRRWRHVDRELTASWLASPPTLEECLEEDWFPEAGARRLRHAEPA